MNLTRIREIFILGLCVPMLASCDFAGKDKTTESPPVSRSSAGGTRTESPDLRPVTDSAPYWCELVPMKAFQNVTGIAGDLVEHWSAHRADSGSCLVRDQNQYGPLAVGWLTDDAKKKVAGRMEKIRTSIRNDNPKRLPSRLGFGFSAYAPGELESKPYVAAVAFRCGGRELSIDISLRRISAGRDATKDLTDLMRIAQRRFGELYDCSPKPF